MGSGTMSPKKSRLLETLQTNEAGGPHAGPAPKKRKQLKRRDTEDKVDRLLASHFADFTAVDTDGTVRNGLTLRQRLLQECRARAKEGGRLSTQMLRQLRSEYMSHEDPMKTLTIKDKDQAFSPDLMKALAACENSNPAKRTKVPLYSFLDTCSALNQKEVVVLFRTFISAKPASSVALRKHILELLKHVVRLEIHKQFPEECGFMRGIFDDTLALTWADMKQGGMAMEQFWEAYGHLAKPLGFHEDLQAVFSEEGSFTHVKVQLLRVTAGSALGAKLFGTAAAMLKVEDFSAQVDAMLIQFKLKSGVTSEEVKDMKDQGFSTQLFVSYHLMLHEWV